MPPFLPFLNVLHQEPTQLGVSGHPCSLSGRTIDTDFLGPLEITTVVALIVSWTSAGDNCTVDGGDGDCRMVTGATTVISGRGDGSLGDVNGKTTGGRSFLATAEDSEEDSSRVPIVRFVILLSMVGGGVGVLDRGKLATSRLTERDLIDPNVWSGDKLAPTEGTIPLLTDPDVTRNGRGVGQGEAGALLTELLVLERVLWGHCGGPPNAPGLVLPPRLQHSAHGVIGVPVTPVVLDPVTGLRG